MSIFKLPDLGEGLLEAEISEWNIAEGDTVEKDQILIALETAKAIVDIPSPQAGQVIKLYGKEGDLIQTGDPLLEFETEDQSQHQSESTDSENKNTAENTILKMKSSDTVVGSIPSSNKIINEQAHSTSPLNKSITSVKATPAVRALAHRLQVDLSIVTPSGPNGSVKVSDVERVAKIFSKVGNLMPLKGVRRAMAISMSKAYAEVVLVTINEDADIECWDKEQDVTIRLIKAIIHACEKEPSLNAWYDSHSMGRRLIKDIHLGIAVDTKEGLFVPVIKDVTSYAPNSLREYINQLKIALNERRVPPEQLRGHTFTLSNFGPIGGQYANPIVIPPTVAILGAGSIRDEIVSVKRQAEFHRKLPLSLSFDHRTVTGGEAGRFLMAVIDDLQNAN